MALLQHAQETKPAQQTSLDITLNREKVMTPDVPLSSPCLAPNSKACCWQRCVKRKSNDGSGMQVEGFIMPKIEDVNQNISCEPAWGTMPRISHCPKASCNVRKSRSSDLLQNEKLNISPKSYLQSSKSGVLSHKPCSAAECDSSHLYNFTNCSPESSCVQAQHIQGACLDLPSKKRVHVAMNGESVCRSEDSCDKESRNEIIRLREALKSERKALRKLHKELEEERCASAAAANEAMAMIRRLQQEKSTALVESRHYRLASEERETYNQEAITLLKEALSVMENEVCSLQEHVEAYRSMLLKLQSRQGNQLEMNEMEEQLLLLAGNQSAPFPLLSPNEPLYYSQIGITDVTEEQASDETMIYRHHLSEATSRQGRHFEDTYCEGHRSDLETNNSFPTQDLEDVSMSILDRVARLEERFSCLGHNQAIDSDCSDREMTRNVGESAATGNLDQHLSPSFSSRPGKLREGFATDNHEDLEDLRCSDIGRVPTNPEHGEQEHGISARNEGAALESFKTKSRGYSRDLSQDVGQESTFLDTRDAEIEGVHDVYEVQCDPNSCGMPACFESCKSLAGSTDVIVNDSLQVFEDKLAERRLSSSVKDTILLNHLEGFNAPADGKLLTEVRPVDEEAMKSSAATEDVHNLTLRLQALEGERAFMKVAIDSLRKENMELKVLQDIAQQLRELKGDVWKTGAKGQGRHEQLSFLSFLKGILSFAGMRSSATTEKRRFLYPCQETSSCNSSHKEQGQAGLFHLLKYPSEEERHRRVMRECKIKLGSVRAQLP